MAPASPARALVAALPSPPLSLSNPPMPPPSTIRGTIAQRLEQLDAGEYDAVIIAACALDRLGLSDRISAYLPWEPAPLPHYLFTLETSPPNYPAGRPPNCAAATTSA